MEIIKLSLTLQIALNVFLCKLHSESLLMNLLGQESNIYDNYFKHPISESLLSQLIILWRGHTRKA